MFWLVTAHTYTHALTHRQTDPHPLTHQELEEARESSPLGLGKEHDPADALILNFWLLEMAGDTFLSRFVLFCSETGSHYAAPLGLELSM